MSSRIRQGILGNLGQVEAESGPTTVRMFTRLQSTLLELDGRVEETYQDMLSRLSANAAVVAAITETDPVYLASDAAAVTAAGIANWDAAYGWGDHAGLYSLLAHDHSGVYSPVAHNHSGTYQPANATLDAVAGGTYTGATSITTLGTITTGTFPYANLSGVPSTFAVDTTAGYNWTGAHTWSLETVHNGGVDVGTSGRFDSNVVDGAGVSNFLFRPTTALTSGTDRYIYRIDNSASATAFVVKSDGTIEFGGTGTVGGYITVAGSRTEASGILFQPANTGSGTTVNTVANTAIGGQFKGFDATGGTATTLVGGNFEAYGTLAKTYAGLWGGYFKGYFPSGIASSVVTVAGGIKIFGYNASGMNIPVPTTWYGMYVQATNQGATRYGVYLEKQTGGATANFTLKSLGLIDCDEDIAARQFIVDGDVSGTASTTTFTGVTDTPTTDPGWATSDTVAMGAPNGYIKAYVGTQAVVIPYWNT